MLKEYGSKDHVPEEFQPLFGASYKVGVEGFDTQSGFVGKQIPEFFVGQALREYAGYRHGIYVLEGIHVVPGTEDHVGGDSKHLVVVNPSEAALLPRTLVRQEKEKGPLTDENRAERMEDYGQIVQIQKHIISAAEARGSAILSSSTEEGILHEFADSLTPKLEALLSAAGVDLDRV
jgi:2-phosphoglycerate kinase